MSTEQNKMLVRRVIEEVFNRGNVSLVDEFLAPNFVERETLPPGISQDREVPREHAGRVQLELASHYCCFGCVKPTETPIWKVTRFARVLIGSKVIVPSS